MQSLRTFFVLIILSMISHQLIAQNQLEDVVYLKDGSIYRGVVTEMVPNESLKIQILGGSLVSISMDEVSKMTKEAPYQIAPSDGASKTPELRTAPELEKGTRPPFEARTKGYFFQSQLLIENLQGGLRIVNGYKFGRFGHLGIGVGFDLNGGSPFNGKVNGLEYNDLAGLYLPLYLYYAGDILKKKVTPFYAIEAGYTHPVTMRDFGFSEDGGSEITVQRGGVMGALGLGVRFNTKRRINFCLLLNVNFKNVTYTREYYLYDANQGVYNFYSTAEENATIIIPGLRFGIGF